MRRNRIALVIALTLVGGCANPLNRVTAERYNETCGDAEQQDVLRVAEEACYRALVNVDLGNLGPEQKSQKLYNLGRIKRRLSKFSEAEQLQRQSLGLEEKLSGESSVKTGRRLVELAVSLAGQDKWREGATYLERVLPIAAQFQGQDRSYTADVLVGFSKKLDQSDVRVQQFTKAATELR